MRIPLSDGRRVLPGLMALSAFFASVALTVTAQSAAPKPKKIAVETANATPAPDIFSQFASAAASDPANSVCPRPAAGSAVTPPSQLVSANGVLQVTFSFQTVVDQAGLTRYCYTSSTGSYEAPTLRVNPGDQLIIHFTNDIPASDARSTSAMPGMVMKPDTAAAATDCNATSVTSTSTNLHFHGLNVSPACHQDEVIHTIIQPQQEFDYTVQIPQNEPSGMYWYHPHPHGFSQNQVLGGATGVIIVEGIQNFNSVVASLPERVLVLRDQALSAAESGGCGSLEQPGNDLSLNYVPVTYPVPSGGSCPGYVPGVITTAAATNEFWRVANTSANSLLNLQILDFAPGSPAPAGVAQKLTVVAIDGVPLNDGSGNPATSSQTSILLPPGARAEFMYTTPASGHTAQLQSLNWNNGPDGDADPARPLANVLPTGSDGGLPITSVAPAPKVSRIPEVSHALPAMRFKALNNAAAATVQRTLYFSIKSDFSQFYITVLGQTPAVYNMDGQPNIVVHSGTVEQWTIQNQSQMDHAFHIHQIHFRTLAINGTAVTDYTERDTIDVPHWSGNASDPYPSVTLLMDFSDPDIIGTFVYHCHILSHEDLGMMGAIQVLPPLVDSTTSLSASATTVAQGSSVTLTATVAGSSGTPTGSVTFSNGSAALGTSTLSASGGATLATAALPLGADSITAAYSGDTTYAASTSSPVTVTVSSGPVISSLSVNYGAAGAPVTITGSNFGASQGASGVTFNGTAASTITSWSSTSIGVHVAHAATTGNLVVHLSGAVSNGVSFTVEPAPAISGVSPASGAVGSTVTISGTNLMDAGGNGYVSFNGVIANLVSQSTTTLVARVPTGATSGSIYVRANGLVVTSPSSFTVASGSGPTISSLSVNYGAPGSPVTISGSNFGATQGTSSVTFNGTAATTITSWSNTSIGVHVAHGATSGNLVIHVGGVASNGVAFTVDATPTITGFSPASGAVGTAVTISGTNLMDAGGNGYVSFNGVPATITSQSSTTLVANVPTGAATGAIYVRANGLVVTSASSFTVVAGSGPAISSLSANYGAQGAPVTINGSNFGATQGASSVAFNGTVASTITSWSSTSIGVHVAHGATSGNLVVKVAGAASNGIAFTIEPVPVISGISPTSGAVGATITISGTNLMDANGNGYVSFNGVPAKITSQSSTSLQATIPSGAATGSVYVRANGLVVTGPTCTIN